MTVLLEYLDLLLQLSIHQKCVCECVFVSVYASVGERGKGK